MVPPADLPDKGFELVKFAAAASKTQQPYEAASSFRVLKALIKQLYFNPHHARAALAELAAQLEDALTMDAASRKTFALFLGRLPVLFTSAF